MKHLHKFLHHHDLPWVKLGWESYYPHGALTARPLGFFWWRNILKLLPHFKQLIRGVIGQGSTISFWSDNWGHGPFKDKYPELFSFSSKYNLTVQEFLQSANTLENFHTPLSAQAHQQLQELQSSLGMCSFLTILIDGFTLGVLTIHPSRCTNT